MRYNHVAIENRIVNLNQGEYQRLCEAFLYKLGYENVFALGSFSGSTKTTPGTPDAFVPQNNEKYVFCEVTTQKDKLYSKILRDLKKCVDEVSLGIQIDKIEKLFYFHTSTNLKPKQIDKINHFCEEKNISFKMYNPTNLALEIKDKYRSLAKEYLNLPLDTNQIVDTSDFADLHDKNDLTAKIQIPFLFRDSEIQEIKKSFETHNVVILTGDAGVGKTRLAWEIAQQFKCAGKYNVFCIKNNGSSLQEDFQIVFERPGKYFLFIDDANELTDLPFILNYCNDKKYNFKLLLTVRNYACTNVQDMVQQYTECVTENLSCFDDNQIKEFLNKNLGILNDAYIDQIVEISQGNPRLAYMAGEYAKKEGNLTSIRDASKFYMAYYKKYFSETKLSTDKERLFTACIVSIVGGVQLDSIEIFQKFFSLYKITEETFLKNIYALHSSEVIDIQFNAAKLAEQSLANYIAYYTFIETKSVSLADFIKNCFSKFQQAVIDSIQMDINIFWSKTTDSYIRDEIKSAWEYFENYEPSLYEPFIKAFHAFNPTKALCYINKLIESSKDNVVSGEDIGFDKTTDYVSDNILSMLSGYRNSDEVSTAIELIVLYALKNQNIINQAYSVLKSYYSVEKESYEQNYRVENVLVDIVIKYCSNEIIQQLFIGIAKNLLQLSFSHTRNNRNMTLSIYSGVLVLSDGAIKYREKIWNKLKELCENRKYITQIIELLKEYPSGWNSKVKKDVLEFDKPYVVKLIKLLPYEKRISKASVANELINRWNQHEIPSNGCFENELAIPEWHIRNVFTGINSKKKWNDDFRVYRHSLIEKFLQQENDIVSVVKVIDSIAEAVPDEKFHLYEGLVDTVDILSENNERLITFIKACMSCNHAICYVPDRLVCKLFEKNTVDSVYNLISTDSLKQSYLWKYAFFICLPKELVTFDYYKSFLNIIPTILEHKYYITDYAILDKFISVETNAYCDVAKIIIQNSEKPEFSTLFYEKTPDELLQLFESDENILRKIYFLSIKNHQNTDYDGKYIVSFINKDIEWLHQYMNFVTSDSKYLAYTDEHGRLAGCWELDNWKEIFDFLFYSSTKKDCVEYDFSFSLMHNLFSTTGENKKELRQRQKEWFFHIISDNCFDEEMIVSVFELISQFDDNMRLECINHLLSINTNISIFKSISLVNSTECWTGSELPLLEKKKDFYKKLIPLTSEIKYLEHKEYIQESIDYYNKRIKRVKSKQFLGGF